jgi:hypothetical protein
LKLEVAAPGQLRYTSAGVGSGSLDGREERVEGVAYELDITTPFGQRMQNLRFRGSPLSLRRKFVPGDEQLAVDLDGTIEGEHARMMEAVCSRNLYPG